MIPGFLTFLASIEEPLYELYKLIAGIAQGDAQAADAEEQAKQVALNIVRAAKDAQAKREIQTP